MSVDTETTGTGWDFLDNFNTGGKYHKIWEAFEDVGRGVRDTKLKNLENSPPPPEQKQKQDEYKKVINTPESQLEQSSSNMTPWLVGGGILLLVLGGS